MNDSPVVDRKVDWGAKGAKNIRDGGHDAAPGQLVYAAIS